MSIKKTLKRMQRYANAWRRLRASKAFAGFTLGTFDELARNADDAQYEISRLEARLRSAMARGEAADAIAMEAMCRVSCAVREDPEERRNQEFYEALGFVPRTKRKNGRGQAEETNILSGSELSCGARAPFARSESHAKRTI